MSEDQSADPDRIGDSPLLWRTIQDAFWVVQAGLDGVEVQGLSIGQRRLASLLLVWAGIENGGFSEPLVNSGGDWMIEAIDAAEMIGAIELARHLRRVVAILGCSDLDFSDRATREALTEALSDEDLASIAADSDSFVGWYELAESYIRSNPSDFLQSEARRQRKRLLYDNRTLDGAPGARRYRQHVVRAGPGFDGFRPLGFNLGKCPS